MLSFKSRWPKVMFAVITMLVILGVTTHAALAQETSTSDLSVKLVSIPKHAKACESFDVTYTVTNLGPDKAVNVNFGMWIPDPFDVKRIQGMPVDLEVGKTAAVTVTLKVTAFVPGESRDWWITGHAWSEVYPNVSNDPNPDNDSATGWIKLISKRVMTCP